MLRGRHNGYIIVLHRIMLGKLSYIVGVWSDKLRGFDSFNTQCYTQCFVCIHVDECECKVNEQMALKKEKVLIN